MGGARSWPRPLWGVVGWSLLRALCPPARLRGGWVASSRGRGTAGWPPLAAGSRGGWVVPSHGRVSAEVGLAEGQLGGPHPSPSPPAAARDGRAVPSRGHVPAGGGPRSPLTSPSPRRRVHPGALRVGGELRGRPHEVLGLHLGRPPGQPPHVLRAGPLQGGQLPLVSPRRGWGGGWGHPPASPWRVPDGGGAWCPPPPACSRGS